MVKYIFLGVDVSCFLGWVVIEFERAGFEVYFLEIIGVYYFLIINYWYDNWMELVN